MSKSNTKVSIKKYLAIVVSFSVVTGFALLPSMHAWSQTPSTATSSNGATSQAAVAAIGPFIACSPNQQALDAIDMNTVVVNNKAKTIHVEKEILNCTNAADQPNIVLVSIYTKIFEDLATLKVIKKSFQVVTCAKNSTGSFLGCQSTKPSTTLPKVTGCSAGGPIAFPLEMNTVTGIFVNQTTQAQVPLAKTIESEKEVFFCNQNPPVVKEVAIFTEIFENMSTNTDIATTTFSTTCIKNVSTAAVLACK